MKKILGIIMCITLSLGFFSCSDSSDDGNDSKELKIISPDVDKAKKEPATDYSEDFTIDLSKNPLSSEGIEKIKNAPAAYLRQSRVDASRAVTGADDKGLESFEVSIKEITAVKVEFTITAKTPSENCSILITAIIPAEVTESKKAVIQLVTQIDVGEPVGDEDIGKSSDLNYATSDELNGLILKTEQKSEQKTGSSKTVYYEFKEGDGSIIINEYRSYGSSIDSTPDMTYTYELNTGKLTQKVNDDEEQNWAKLMGELGMDYRLVKIDSDFYLCSMKLDRSSGQDLDSTFSSHFTLKKSIKKDGLAMTDVTASFDCAVTTTSKGIFTGASVYSCKISMSPEIKKMMEQFGALGGEDLSSLVSNDSQNSNIDFTGVYVNNNGILSINGKSILNLQTEEGAEQEIKEFENTIALYDGKSIYFAEKLEKVDSLPR